MNTRTSHRKRNTPRVALGICLMTSLLLSITACGLTQAAKDGMADATEWAFTTKIKMMNLDVIGRASLNPNSRGQALSTVVRIYQLKSEKIFEQLDYAQLQSNDHESLKADLLTSKNLVLRPDSNISLSEAMNPETEYIGVAAFFRETNKTTQWKLVLPKKQWKETDPVKIEVRGSSLNLVKT